MPTEDEMVGWHHRLDRHEFEQAPGDCYVYVDIWENAEFLLEKSA